MIKFEIIKMNENLLDVIFENELQNGTLLIFPTKPEAISLSKRCFENSPLSEINFITINELKELIFISENPILREEKRYLSFYSSLSDDFKKIFNCSNYFSTKIFADEFFNFYYVLHSKILKLNLLISIISYWLKY